MRKSSRNRKYRELAKTHRVKLFPIIGGCGKTGCYPSKAIAKKEMARLNATADHNLKRVYYCDKCHVWHATSRPSWVESFELLNPYFVGSINNSATEEINFNKSVIPGQLELFTYQGIGHEIIYHTITLNSRKRRAKEKAQEKFKSEEYKREYRFRKMVKRLFKTDKNKRGYILISPDYCDGYKCGRRLSATGKTGTN